MSYMGDRLIDFEADNYDDLVEKFLDIKEIREKWEQFIYDEYESDMPEPDIDDIIDQEKEKEMGL